MSYFAFGLFLWLSVSFLRHFWKPFLGIRISSFTLTIFLLETRKTRQFETPFQIKAPRMMMVLIITIIKMMILIIMMMIVIITIIIIIYNNRLWIYESHIFELRIKGVNIKEIFAVMNTTWAVVKRRPVRNSGLYGIWTHDLCDTGAVLYQLS